MNAKAETVEAELVDGVPGDDDLETAAVVHVPTAATPMALIERAIETNADLDKMQQLMDLQDRWERNQAKKAYVVAMQEFKANPPAIIKNVSGNYGKYADLAQVSRAVGEALAAVGISHRWEVKQDNGAVTVWCILTHREGHSEQVSMSAPPDDSGSKNAVQQIASTITYLERYTLMAVAGVAAQDDNDGGPPRDLTPISEAQLSQLLDKMTAVEADETKFLKYLKLETLEQLPAAQFDYAMKALQAKEAKQ